jgi:hypothetical protein
MAAGGAPARWSVTASPRTQHILEPVIFRGAHWKVTAGCTRAVRLVLRPTSGDPVRLRASRVRADGTFAAAWIPTRYTTGIVHVVAAQTCRTRSYLAATAFLVLPAP